MSVYFPIVISMVVYCSMVRGAGTIPHVDRCAGILSYGNHYPVIFP